ncbi:TolC family protein [Azospira inquinata]|uniref:TolC family protein n=1 Tax=Azospira inquinata TaxID=2785627 RepID=A0A975SNE4_9RHOO|nr:TolC family protein [Azospira inquinata]QWT45093.1 TolC family protein [Azospira inquinata]QWT49573.1 TolC family protein [Azospira inquinata]
MPHPHFPRPLRPLGLILGLCYALSGPAWGAEGLPTPPYPSADLPPLQAALQAIRNAPMAKEADAMLSAEQANRKRLEAGPYEWTTRLTTQQRRVNPSDERFREWQGALEHTLRLPGKAALDAKIGAQGEATAHTALGDALHETSRSLLQTWFDWLRARETARQWAAQADSQEKQRRTTTRRVQLGDAPKLELMQAEAAAAQAQAAREQARLQEQVALAALSARFPTLPRPENIHPSEPQPLEPGPWQERLLTQSHELTLARAQTEHARLLASRADADKLPDPTVGVQIGSERAGEERLAALTLTIPLPGGARRAAADQQVALSSAAASREAAAQAKVSAEVAGLLATARAAYDSWRLAEDAARRMEESAHLMGRAYQLGEAGIAELLVAQRQANEARLGANRARLDALEARYRVYVDAHLLWDADED